MEVFPTFFTEILLRESVVIAQTDTGAMLPNMTNVALYKESCKIFGYLSWEDGLKVDSLLGDAFEVLERGRAGVVLVAADAPDGLVVLLNVVSPVCHFVVVWVCSFILAVLVV